MIRFFKSLNTISLFFIPAIAVLLWLRGFTKPEFVTESPTGLLYGIVTGLLSVLPRFVQVLLAMALVGYEAIYFNLVLNRHDVLYKKSFLPSLFYVLVLSFSAGITVLHPLLIVNLILLMMIDRLFLLFRSTVPVARIFDSCFLIAICSLLYFPSIVLFALFLFALYALRPFSLREWLTGMVAFLLPYFFLAVFAFVTDSLEKYYELFLSQFSIHVQWLTAEELKIILLPGVFLLLLLILSLLKMRANYYKNAIRTRSAIQIMLVYLVLALAAFVLSKPLVITDLMLAAIPVSTFIAYYYLSLKKRMWLVELSFWILVVLVAGNNYLS